jgi:prepilin-type N-terminal cleavage/methylation domain-containing protein
MLISSSRRPGWKRGFSIIELMITVSIVGILAAIAIPLLMNYQLRAKTAEGKTNLAAIRVLETAHFSENDFFLAIVPEPPVIPGNTTSAFNGAAGFAGLGFRPEGSVYFSYGVAVTPDGAGFTADAGADIDADGFVQFWGYAKPDNAGVLVPGAVGCDAAGLSAEVVGPCNPAYGKSVF